MARRKAVLSHDELADLLDKARNGDQETLDRIVLANIGLVHVIALEYRAWAKSHYIEYDDIWQQGVLGLYASIRRYDPDKGKFSTYASIPIHHQIIDYVFANSWKLDTNDHRFKAKKQAAVKAEFFHRHGRWPTITELADLSGLSEKSATYYDTPAIRLLRTDQIDYGSWHRLTEPDPEDVELLIDLRNAVASLKETEDPIMVQMAEMYFGFTETGDPISRAAIARFFGVSSEAVFKNVYRYTKRLAKELHVHKLTDNSQLSYWSEDDTWQPKRRYYV
ncbi:sigma-70 family RNA polymerase sigma factor [Ferrimicrobium acidiphilum]|jgi:RNA polymerase sigma factor (sigma-70 family)|uniref:sigma-70 family RNA polymerase sigma factor n=1 Tax=Ferrimicrobium acidiphilum TaxID=121039 RepID=UPI0023F0041B|nr:sigma-70 family RNA polymerase sigma factor [Ferrimicrobium acidiphilum]